jgi:tRNA A-37 threonylcarbamoyl transferase component Bud32
MLTDANTLLTSLNAFGLNACSMNLIGGSQLEIVEIVRTVPDRRLVCKALWNEYHKVYAKIFVGPKAKRYANRDKSGVLLLQKAGIQTPQILLNTDFTDQSATVLIFSEISGAINAEQAYANLSKVERLNLMSLLATEIAYHHQNRLIQTDLYLKNFLVQQKSGHDDLIYTLDGDGIRLLSPFFQQQQKLQNLATLFSKMDVLDDVWIADLYTQYCAKLGVVNSEIGKAQVCLLTQKIRHQVASNYAEKKVFRNCTDVKIKRSFKIFHAQTADFVIEDLVPESLDALLAKSKYNIKNGNTCSISKAEIAKKNVVIKRYNIKSFWHGVNRFFRCSRAARSWANAHRLIISNIATAKPLALIEERWGWFRRRAYYLTEYIDAPDVMQFFTQSSNLQEQQVVASNLANLFYKLYLLKFSHGDCKATNIKIVNLAPVLIDLDGLQAHFGRVFGNWWFERKHIKDLKRLMKNWANDANVTTLLKQAFILQYATQQSNENNGILLRAGLV